MGRTKPGVNTERSMHAAGSRVANVFRTVFGPRGVPVTSALLALTVGTSVLVIGAVHTTTMWVVGGLASLGLLAAIVTASRDDRSPWFGPAIACWCLAGWSLLQVVPLPMATLESLAPVNADVWQRSLMPAQLEAPEMAPVSLDPAATWLEALRWFTYGSVFTSSAVIASRRGATWGISLVVGIAVLAALVTLVHGLLGLDTLYGLYEPSFRAQPWHVGPLLNANNLAGLLNLGALCGLGLVASRNPPWPRWLLAVAVAFVVGVGITTASRSGVIALMLGFLLYLAMTEVLRRRRGRVTETQRRSRLAVGATFLAGGGLAVLGMVREGWEELLNADLGKLALLSEVQVAFDDFRWFGMGRGAFQSAYAAYSPRTGNFVLTHAENFIAQWVVEWGTPVAVIALLAFGFWFRPRMLGAHRSHVAATAWVGFFVVVVQNLADLGFEIPGLVVPLAVVLGTLSGRNGGRRSVESSAPKRPILVGTGVVIAVTILLTGAVRIGQHSLAADQARVEEALQNAPRPLRGEVEAVVRAKIVDAMKRHPAEPYFPLAGALLAWETGRENPMPWLQRTLERARHSGRAHLLLALVLHRYGHLNQALLELRLAIHDDSLLLRDAATLATNWTDDLATLEAVVPRSDVAMAAVVWAELGRRAPHRPLGALCDQRAIELDDTLHAPRVRLAQDLLDAIDHQDPKCVPAGRCDRALEAHLAALEGSDSGLSAPLVMRGRWLALQERHQDALVLFADGCDRVSDPEVCLRAWVEVAADVTAPEPLLTAAKALRARACNNAGRCAAVNAWVGDLHVRRGEHGAAMAAYERSLRDNETDHVLEKLAAACQERGLNSRAVQVLERLLKRRGGSDAAIEARLRKARGQPASPH